MSKPISKDNMPKPGDMVELIPSYFERRTYSFGMFLKMKRPPPDSYLDIEQKEMYSVYELLVGDRKVIAYGYEFYVL